MLGDALAVALLQEKGFQREDFARIHPGGALGRQLVVRVEEIMLRQNFRCSRGDTMREAIVMIAERRGIAIVVDDGGHVEGVLTAGDLSRLIERGGDIMPIAIRDVMTRGPKIAQAGELASAVAYRMEQHGIMAMPVVDGDDRWPASCTCTTCCARESSEQSVCAPRSVARDGAHRNARRRGVQGIQAAPVAAAPTVADSADQVFIKASFLMPRAAFSAAD